MTIWDDRILELIREEGGATVKVIADNEKIRVSRSTVSRRCATLAEKGLLKKIGEGAYIITDDGEAYLDGELDASELNDENGEEEDEAPPESKTPADTEGISEEG